MKTIDFYSGEQNKKRIEFCKKLNTPDNSSRNIHDIFNAGIDFAKSEIEKLNDVNNVELINKNEKLTSENIQSGQTFYVLTDVAIVKYEYLSIFPCKIDFKIKHHIIINRYTNQPERVYFCRLDEFLQKKLFTYEDAKEAYKRRLEMTLRYFDKQF